ncbi:MAG: tetracycline resistance MFS efflux pump [Isosphaeraceae bacterium]
MSPLLVVVSIVLVDLLGFTIVMPLLPRFAKEYGFDPSQIGMLLAAYPRLQRISGPVLGRLSDRYGRRPILAISQAGTAVSFLILGLSRDFRIMLLARMLDGASGGNILVAQAYVADVTKPENRSKSLGLIGAAFGLGFAFGPLLGGLLASAPVGREWQLRLPFLVAAGFSTIAWLLVLFKLPESLPADVRGRQKARTLSLRGLADTIRLPGIGLLVLVGALNTLAFAALEGTFSLFLDNRFQWSASQAAYAFAFLGIISALVQGGLIRRLLPRFGEPRLMIFGLLVLSFGLASLALAKTFPLLILAGLLIGLGQGTSGPSIQGLLSRLTPATEQGAVFGVLTSAQTFARMINYYFGNRLLSRGSADPYWEGSAIALVAIVIAFAAIGRIRKPGLIAGEDLAAASGGRDQLGQPL